MISTGRVIPWNEGTGKSCSWRGVNSFTITLLCLILGLMHGTLQGQTVTVETPQTVRAGERFSVSYIVHEKVLKFKPPLWGKINCYGGPSTFNSRQIQFINGKMTEEVTYQYQYVCVVNTPGNYTIPSAEFEVASGTVKSEPQPLEVIPAPEGANSSPGSGAQTENGNTQSGYKDENLSENLFVRLEVNRTNVYRNEPIVVTLKIYTRLPLTGFEGIKYPDFKGFWSKEIDTPNSVSFKAQAVNGREYHAGVLRQLLLFPQKNGTLTIEPFEAEVVYNVPSSQHSIFDPFFGGGYDTQVAKIKSLPVQIQVKELPNGQPQGFSGAVGNFALEVTTDSEKALTNQAVTYTLEVKGKGNLQLLTKPEIAFPSTIEAFPPKIIEKYSIGNGTQQGSVLYQYILIPRAPGNIEIPEVTYSYFDPQSASYKVLKGKSISLEVTADTTAQNSPILSSSAVGKEDIQYLGKDIRHIQMKMPQSTKTGKRYMNTTLWWAILLGLLAVSLAVGFYLLRYRSLEANERKAREVKANRVAQKRLKQAKKLQGGEDAPFYRELLNALWGYLSDKLSIPQADLSAGNVRQLLEARNISTETITQLLQTIEHCEYAQFAPDKDRTHLQDTLYQEVHDIIALLNGTLRG